MAKVSHSSTFKVTNLPSPHLFKHCLAKESHRSVIVSVYAHVRYLNVWIVTKVKSRFSVNLRCLFLVLLSSIFSIPSLLAPPLILHQTSLVLTLALLIDKETINKWHISGSIKKAYDRSVKGYVYMTDINSKLQMPKDTRKQELYLVQPYLLL